MSEQSKKTILIVEDDLILARMGQKILAQCGHRSIVANTGEEAVDIFKKNDDAIDLILMDIDLGSGIDGTEAAAIILKDCDVPVVFLSSHTEPEIVEKTEKITSYGYVVKGSGITVLDASIKMAFKLFEANNKLKCELNKMLEKHLDLTTEILCILNEDQPFPTAIQNILGAIKEKIGIDAVGLRLKNEDDFPYYAHNGFSSDFLRAENSLISRDAAGGPCRDKDGKLCLECTCGLVLSGLADPADPLFTEGGSCWTNDTLPFLDLPADQDIRTHPRDTCTHKGYRSVALIPIRANREIVGLLQLNDHKKDRFTLEMIHFFEKISANIGMALLRKQAAEASFDLETHYRRLFETARDGILVIDFATGAVIDVNPFLAGLLGCQPDQFTGKAAWDIEFLNNIIEDETKFKQLRENECVRYEGLRLKTASGNIIVVEFVSNVYEAGNKKNIQCNIRNITS